MIKRKTEEKAVYTVSGAAFFLSPLGTLVPHRALWVDCAVVAVSAVSALLCLRGPGRLGPFDMRPFELGLVHVCVGIICAGNLFSVDMGLNVWFLAVLVDAVRRMVFSRDGGPSESPRLCKVVVACVDVLFVAALVVRVALPA